MPRKPKPEEPELLLVPFCDVVTVITSALFMTMIITIQEAMKVPVLNPTPRMKTDIVAVGPSSTNAAMGSTVGAAGVKKTVTAKLAPVYFECRGNELFPVDLPALKSQLANLKKPTGTSTNGGLQGIAQIQEQEIGDDYYRINTTRLLVGELALEPRTGAKGVKLREVTGFTGAFPPLLRKVNREKQYVVFLVRDDSFEIFREARQMVHKDGYNSGWEYLGPNDLIKFGGLFGTVKVGIQ